MFHCVGNRKDEDLQMIKNLINKLMEAKNSNEIISYKTQVVDLYDSLYNKIYSGFYCKTNFDDIKNLYDLECPMMAYYGPYFYEKCGIPFLKKHNPETIEFLELTVLFYTIQIVNLLESGFFNEVSLCVYKTSSQIFDYVEKIDLTKHNNEQSLFILFWSYFMRIITIEDNTREFKIECNGNIEEFYLRDEEYEEVIDMIYKNYNNSNYSKIINKILGIYKIRFTKMDYVLNYQPMFVRVGYKYLCTF